MVPHKKLSSGRSSKRSSKGPVRGPIRGLERSNKRPSKRPDKGSSKRSSKISYHRVIRHVLMFSVGYPRLEEQKGYIETARKKGQNSLIAREVSLVYLQTAIQI